MPRTDERSEDRARLEAVLRAYGSDPARWPAADRPLARLLERPDAALRAMLEEEAALDRALDEAALPAPSATLAGRVLAAAPAGERWARRLAAALWPFGPLWQPAAALVCAAAVGLAVGLTVPRTEAVADSTAGYVGLWSDVDDLESAL